MSFQKFPRYSNLIYHRPIQILFHCLVPSTREVWTIHGVSINGVIGSNREILDHVVAHRVFKYLSYGLQIIPWNSRTSLSVVISFVDNPSRFPVHFV